MTIWKEPVTKNGVTETYLQDAKGRTFVRYEGLDTSHKVSEASYAKLIDTINSKGNQNFVMEDGSQYTFDEAVAMMREKLDAYPDRLPEGMGKNQAIYLAMMRARYTGKMDILNDIKCNDGPISLLEGEASKYATNPGHIGRLITDKPLPTKVGPASVMGDPCTTNLGQTNGVDAMIEGASTEASPKVTVDMNNPYAEGKGVYASDKHNYRVDLTSMADEGSEVKGARPSEFVTFINNKSGINITDADNVTSSVKGVHYHAPHDATAIINNLKEPTSVSTDSTTGVTTITYEFDKGSTVSVVLDKASDSGTRTGHFLVKGKECIIDQKSSQALTETLTKHGVAGASYTSVENDNVLADNMPKGHEKIDAKITEIAGKQTGAIPSTEASSLTSDQVDAIRYGEDTQFTCTDVKDGKVTLTVSGVEGITRPISVAEPVGLDLKDATYTSEGISTYATKDAAVTITTKSGENLVVMYANGKAIPTMNGKPVILDSKTCQAAEAITNQAFAAKNVSIETNLHSDFTDKIVSAYETFKANEASSATKVVSNIMHQTKSGYKGMA